MKVSRAHRALEVAAIIASAVLCVATILRLGHLGSMLVVLVVALVGYATADLATGLMHWCGDNVGDESWPVVGRHFIRPFREHHVDPMDITKHGVLEINGNNAIVAVPLLVIVSWLAPRAPHFALGALVMLVAVIATNQLHAWAHATNPPRIVRALQGVRLILHPAEHARHHATHDRAYCVTNGWLNRLVDRMPKMRSQ